jgi:hypothetical protein
MPKRNGEWEEHYGIDVREYETFVADAAEAFGFAGECRREDISTDGCPGPGRLRTSESLSTGSVWPESGQPC